MAYKTTIEKIWNGRTVKIQGVKAVGRSAFEIGLSIEGQAKLLVPIKSGRLAGSITVQAKDTGTSIRTPALAEDRIGKPAEDRQIVVHVGTAVDYAPYIEFGTVKSRAQPFLRPAFDLAAGKSLSIIEREGKLAFREFLN